MNQATKVDKYQIVTPEVLAEFFTLDREAGRVVWKKRRRSAVVGSVASHATKRGYRDVQLYYQGRQHLFREHVVVWALLHGAYPEGEIDHANRDRGDNRPENLRLATRSQNARNSLKPGRDLPPGVYPSKSARNPYMAQIRVEGGKVRYLGSFPTPELASIVYQEAQREINGVFAPLPPDPAEGAEALLVVSQVLDHEVDVAGDHRRGLVAQQPLEREGAAPVAEEERRRRVS